MTNKKYSSPFFSTNIFHLTHTFFLEFRISNRQNFIDNQNFIFRDSFEFSSDPRSFFNEEDPAVERMARAFADAAVSAFVNGIGVKEEKH